MDNKCLFQSVVFILSALIFLSGAQVIYAQKPPIKWGRVSDNEWALKKVSYDPEASAIMLCEYGVARFQGANLFIDIHKRVKVLRQEALGLETDITIPFYAKDNIQNVTNIKAHTLNRNGAKTEEASLSHKDIYESDYSENWKMKKFTFPMAKVGSIIEYSYTITSNSYLYLKSWDFQNDIPTAHSEFRALIPEYLDYRVLLQGNRLISQYTDKPGNRWLLKNTVALSEEPYMTTLDNFRERVRFQLSGYYARSTGMDTTAPEYKSLMTTWDKLNQELMTDYYFGAQLRNKPLAKEILAGLKLEGLSDRDKAERIYSYVQSNYNWDQTHRRFVKEELKQLYQKKEGASADINLMLCMLLRNAGIQASPVMISTRDNGYVTKRYPLLSQFNHVIVQATVGNDEYLLDATDRYCPFNLLGLKDLNNVGLMLSDKSEPKWIDIPVPKSNSRTFLIKIDLRDLEKPSAQIQCALKGYYARDLREGLANQKKNIIPVNGSPIPTDAWEVSHLDELSKTLTMSSPEISLSVETAGKNIYVQPVLVNYYRENPFKTEAREYPISFGTPFSEVYRVEVLLPKGYKIDEIPESQLLKLPNNRGSIQYQLQANYNKVNLLVRFDIKTPDFGVGFYSRLRQFFDTAIEKLNTTLVFSRDQN